LEHNHQVQNEGVREKWRMVNWDKFNDDGNVDKPSLLPGVIKTNGTGSVVQLVLVNCKIHSLPDSFGSFQHLQHLELRSTTNDQGSGNLLKTLPESFCELVSLTSLDLSNNILQALPESFGSLVALLDMDLGGNQLTALPASICNLTALKRLCLDNQRGLTALPHKFGQLRSLEDCDLQTNELNGLPDSFTQLTSLRRCTLVAAGLDKDKVSALRESMKWSKFFNGAV
jgi:hypothetical protein